MRQDRLCIALQKSGRLAEESLALLKACGLHIARGKDQLLVRVREIPLDVLFVRDDDIPAFVSRGVCGLGIVGENVFQERRLEDSSGFHATILQRLGFSACRLALAAPEEGPITTPETLAGKTVATTYPHLLGAFLRERHLDATVLTMNGSVEVAPRLKIADAICDLVASGATLAANGLREITTVLNSEALLIRPDIPLSPAHESVITRLLTRIKGTLQAEDSKYIMLHAPRDHLAAITALLPGCESPTVLPLQGSPDKVAVHAVCRETVFWETMEQLKAAGASSILILPIEKMMG